MTIQGVDNIFVMTLWLRCLFVMLPLAHADVLIHWITQYLSWGVSILWRFLQFSGWILKLFRRAEGGTNIFGVFRVKNHDFTPKNHIFSNFRGVRAGCTPWIRPCIRNWSRYVKISRQFVYLSRLKFVTLNKIIMFIYRFKKKQISYLIQIQNAQG
jgi:hypothetical protein